MEAVVLNSPRSVSIETVAEPVLQKPSDVILRLTSTAICGTDLHMYEGRLTSGVPMVIGHEPLGVVEQIGADVVNVRIGDRVTVPTHICCGFCANCAHGFSAQCLTNNPGKTGAAYGYPGMGEYLGAQTALLRVPFADANCCGSQANPGTLSSTTSSCSPMPCPLPSTPPNLRGFVTTISWLSTERAPSGS